MAHQRGTSDVPVGLAGLADRATVERALTALQSVTDADISDLLALAADLTGVEVAALAVADADAFHYPVTVGTDPFTTPYAEALCRRAQGVPGLFEVPDTALDPHLRDSPLVTGEVAAVRFYASAPLTTAAGQEFGDMCGGQHRDVQPLLPLQHQPAAARRRAAPGAGDARGRREPDPRAAAAPPGPDPAPDR